MAVKRFFGADSVLHTVELPDRPFPVDTLKGDLSVHQLLNPTNVDPDTLPVDAAAFPDLRPTDGAQAMTKFPDRIPGSGEGAGVGQRSGLTLRDAWENNPDRVGTTQVETVQSGEIGERAAVAPPLGPQADVDRTQGGSTTSPEPVAGEKPDDTWTKAQLGEYITANGGEAPAESELKAVFLEKATETYDTKQLA